MHHFPDGYAALVQGASRGIGLEVVRQLLSDERCGSVFATARRPDSQGLQALSKSEPDRLRCVYLDVTEPGSIESAATDVAAEVERLHLLFNVAGLLHDSAGMSPEKRLADISLESLEKGFRVNAFGPMLVSQAFFPLLKHSDRAVLANMSARVGSIEDNRLGGWYAYRCAKAAQNQFTRTLSVEAVRSARKLIVLALHPGTTDTGLSEPFQSGVPEGRLFSSQRSVTQLLQIIDQASIEDSGRFIAWDGQDIPW